MRNHLIKEPKTCGMEKPRDIDASIRDLIAIIQFTEKVSAEIHGLLNVNDIYKVIDDNFRASKDYNAAIALLSEDGKLIIKTASNLSAGVILKAEKFAGIALRNLDLLRSKSFKKVIDEDKTVYINSEEIVCDLFPKPIAHMIARIVRYEYMPTIIAPIHEKGKIIGVLGVNSPILGDYFIATVENLCKHISTALELSDEISGRMKAEQEVRSLNESLERQVAERTKDLIEIRERLLQAEKMEAMGRLAGGIAHDFNNQLAGIMACADLLRSGLVDNGPLYELADMIIKAAERSALFTSQLLAFARKGKYQSIPQNIHTIVGEVISLLERSISKKIAIRRHLDARSVIVSGDPAQLHNAFLNIALNARDAMPDGGELVFATKNRAFTAEDSNAPDSGPGEFIEVSVSDTGVGMPDDVRKKIFEPFFTTKEQGKGTGLGLAAVYGIVKNHRGHIDVRSEEGKGSLFRIYLPVVHCEKAGIEAPPALDTGTRSGTILIADDETIILDALSRVLQKYGYKTLICRNGRETLECYRKLWETIDIVLLDLMMPEMDGREAFSAIRKINPGARVILSSGYCIDKEVRKIIDEGALGFIQKPFGIETLLYHIAAVSGREGTA